MREEDPLVRVLNKVFQFWLHSGSFPEEGDPSTGKAWPPEIQAVITRAQAVRAAEGPSTAPLNGFIAPLLAEALWDYVAVRARTWTERERGRKYLSALIVTEQNLVAIDGKPVWDQVLARLRDEDYLQETYKLGSQLAGEVRRETEQVADRTFFRRRRAGIHLMAEALCYASGAPGGSRLGRRGLPTLPPRQSPPLPDFFVPREQFGPLILAALEQEDAQTLVLWGPGGAGKTTLAAWAAGALADRFPDGVVWVESGPNARATDVQEHIAHSFGVALSGSTAAERAGQLRTLLHEKRCLLVLDDLDATPDLVHLQVTGAGGRLLVTTRDVKVADVLAAPLVQVGGLSTAEGLELLAAWAQLDPERAEARELVARLGGHPLALRLAGAVLRGGEPLADLVGALRGKQIDLSLLDMHDPQAATESLTLCFDLTFNRLEPATRRRFAQLSCFAGAFPERAAAVMWGVEPSEARQILRWLMRFALLERQTDGYRLHPLLRDYASQRLAARPDEAHTTHRRHAAWYIRYALYHPQVIDDSTEPAPDLDPAWADVVQAVNWATDHAPRLAVQAVLLAHTERPALLEAVGPPLIEAAAAYLDLASGWDEQALLHELLGDLHLLQGIYESGLAHFGHASERWAALAQWLAASRTQLRVAGGWLLLQNWEAAAKAARQARSLLQEAMPLREEDRQAVDRLFYWFDLVYNPLVRWEGLPETEAAALARLAADVADPIVQARALHIYRLWCTAEKATRTERARDLGRSLAVQAYRFWRAGGRLDRADDEINFTGRLLNGRYSSRAGGRYARRRSSSTPVVSPDQVRLVSSEGMRWWLGATETQRVAWLSRMLPRYLGASNCVSAQLATGSRAWHWVNDILNVAILGNEQRRLALHDQPPGGHILNGPEWQALSGRRPRPWAEGGTMRLIQAILTEVAHEVSR
jgi:hypothetical protein